MKALPPSLFALRLLLLGCAACELTERDLDAFQTTATGPAKIRAVLEDGAQDPELRARAAMLLLDLDRHDLRGPKELQRELSTLTSASRAKLFGPLSRTLLARMRTKVSVSPSPTAIRAKTAIEDALPLLGAAQQKELGQELMRWVVTDLEKRADAGGHSLEELSAQLGADAAEPLLTGLRSDVPLSDIARLSGLLDRHASGAVRARSATQLLEVARKLNKPAAILSDLGRFADQENVRLELTAIARDQARDMASRLEALTLLTNHMTSRELLPVLGLALDEQEDSALRELAIARVGETRSNEALPGLLMLLGDRNRPRLRMLAGAQVLDIGGPKMLASFFRALPHGWSVPYSRDEIDAYSERINRFKPDFALLMLLGEKLHSTLWCPRVLALRWFGAQGTFADLWRIRRHESDTLQILGDGWPRGYTVGQEAGGCLNALNKRLLRGR